ncbi:alpha/beta hydrolase [Marinomonas sp. A79]|uniref:Alpha/beta hydrolase n=1 Tax=Marinomonas vulgaris TaxID=2823372 RepID=A0ABS5H766_9GAMM|nr:alpha/beta hydrolase [Marinomonas vulgaris]MBR7887546.1 alpha/beta hydrolase [Marinomonas vulgaris]
MNCKKWNFALSPWLLCLVVLVLSGCASSSKPQQEDVNGSFSAEVEGNVAYLFGVLGSDLAAQLSDLIEAYPNVTDLVLVDVPGSVDQQATMEGARLIRRLGLNTHIAPTGYVLSGGVDLFLGGVNRTIGGGAGVGVHAWSDGSLTRAENLNIADPVHAVYVNFYLEMGVPERFYWFSLDAAPAERVYFLSPEETYDFRLATQ